MRKLCCLLLAAVLSLLFFTGCGGSAEDYRVSYDLSAEPVNLDPQTASDQASLTVINSIFEGLFTVNALGELENAVAAGYTVSADGLSYTFTLREDAFWSGTDENGEALLAPVTAHDFVFALRRLLRPNTNSPAATRYYSIKNARGVHQGGMPEASLGVTAVSDSQLKITLETPSDNLLSLLASTYAMPCNEAFFTGTRGKYGLEPASIMANGPFDLRSWEHGKVVRLIRNENYYNAGSVKPSGVTLWISSAAPEERLLSETVDAAVVKGERIESLNGGKFNTEPIENAVWGLCLNLENKSLANESIRFGIAGAFDRSAYAGLLSANLAEAKALVPHGAALYGENYRKYAGETLVRRFDAALAYEYYRAGLEELGAGSVSGLRLLVSSDGGTDVVAPFQSVSQVLQRELSLFISVDEVPEKEFNSRLRSGSFDLALCRVEASDNTPWSVLSQFQSESPQNYASYSNAEVDALLAAAQASQEQMLASCREAERLILEDAAFIPMFYSTDYFVTRQDTTGIAYNPQTGLVSFREAVRS